MKIRQSTITALMASGYLTLQVPQVSLWIGQEPPPMESYQDLIDAPDDWFCELSGGAPCVGKSRGFLFLTRKGYEANKQQIREAFEHAVANGRDRTDGEGWSAFERHVEEHFVSVQVEANKKLLAAQKALNNAEFRVQLSIQIGEE